MTVKLTVRTAANRTVIFLLTLALLALPSSSAIAADILGGSSFQGTVKPLNAGGGLSYLPNGDLLALTSDFLGGPQLIIYDANGDGLPIGSVGVGQQQLAQFTPSDFGGFVEVAPSGLFALVGLTGASTTVYRVDLTTNQVTPYLDAPGSFDLVFVDDTVAYLSSNPGGFDITQPNIISRVELSQPPVVKVVASIAATPSGPLALNAEGDLYYVRGTFTFPPPAGSSALLRFDAAALEDAAQSGVPLAESNSEIGVPLDGGYGLAYRKRFSEPGELYLTAISKEVFRIAENTLTPELFLSIDDPDLTAPALTAISFYNSVGVFDTNGAGQTKLGISLSTDFFSTFSLLELTRTFSPNFVPLLGATTGGRGVIKIQMESLLEEGLRYEVEIRDAKTRKVVRRVISSSSSLRIRKLNKGSYRVRFRIIRKLGAVTERSKPSLAVVVRVR